MKVRSIALATCLIISSGCLGVEYILAGHWLILPAFLVMGLMWTITKKYSMFWSASSSLLVFVVLAAIGITVELSPVLMSVACTSALVSWDLSQFNQGTVENSRGTPNRWLEKSHLNSLAFAASAGLILAFFSLYMNLYLTFAVIIFLVLITIGCFIYGVQYILKKNQ